MRSRFGLSVSIEKKLHVFPLYPHAFSPVEAAEATASTSVTDKAAALHFRGGMSQASVDILVDESVLQTVHRNIVRMFICKSKSCKTGLCASNSKKSRLKKAMGWDWDSLAP